MTTRLVRTLATCVAVLAPVTGGAGAADLELTVFEWAGYEDPAYYPAYLEKHSELPGFAFFGDEQEAFQKLQAGFRADIAHPCSGDVPKWRDAGLLKPFDTSRIDAWNDLYKGLREMPGISHDGKTYFVPVDWGNTVLVYRTDLVPEEDVRSLQVFADPAYRGKITLPDSVDEAYALASLVIGVKDWTKMTDSELDSASAFLRQVHKNVRVYWQDSGTLAQMMASGEVAIAWAWNETSYVLQSEGHPVALKRDTEEGHTAWVCGFVLLSEAKGNEDKAYDFINAFLGDRAAEFLVHSSGYGHANKAAMDKLDQALLASLGFDDVDKFRTKTKWQGPPPTAIHQKMIAEFEKIKAGF